MLMIVPTHRQFCQLTKGNLQPHWKLAHDRLFPPRGANFHQIQDLSKQTVFSTLLLLLPWVPLSHMGGLFCAGICLFFHLSHQCDLGLMWSPQVASRWPIPPFCFPPFIPIDVNSNILHTHTLLLLLFFSINPFCLTALRALYLVFLILLFHEH